MPFTSQLGQDKWIIEEVFPGLRKGFFLDVGATDGVSLSNTYALEKDFGWDGICVEPNTPSFDLCSSVRKCTCVNLCLDRKSGPVQFMQDDYALGMLSSIVCENADHVAQERMAAKPELIVTKEALSIPDLLRQYRAPDTIHYMSIDTEGTELQILQGYFEAKTPQTKILAMTIEHNAEHGPKNTARRAGMRALLESHGYRFHRQERWDDYYLLRQE